MTSYRFIEALNSIYDAIVSWLEQMSEISSEFIFFLRASFSFMPEEVMLMISLCICISLVWLLVKILRG